MELSVVVPVYNSQDALPPLVERLGGVLEELAERFEVVLVDDGSSDGSWEVLRGLAAERSWVRPLQLKRNYGQHNALLCGIRAAQYEVVVTLDDDLQNPPEEIGKLVAALGSGVDVVYGRPRRAQHGILRNLTSSVTKIALQSSMGAETARSVSAFRAFRTDLREAFAGYESPFVSIDVLLTWGTSRFADVRVQHEPRTIGKSQYTLGRLIRHALNMMTGFSVLPLQLASIIGFVFWVFGMGVLAFVVSRYLVQGVVVPGFTFLASTIAVFAGAQLLALGIIGEYLARMHHRLMGRPAYSVRSSLNDPAPGPGG